MQTDWARLCELLDDDPALPPAVEEALAAPEDSDPWMAVIDGLDDAGALAYLDQQDSGVELSDALPQLPRVFRTGVDLDTVGDVEGDLPSAIVAADSILSTHDLRIVHLEEEDDAYPLVVVPLANVEEVIALASRVGHSARVFS